MKFLEETLLLIAISFMVIYLYGEYHSSSSRYDHILWLIPILLFIIMITITKSKR